MAEWEHPEGLATPSDEPPGQRSEPPGPPADGGAALARRLGQFEAIQAISAEITRELDLTRLLRLIIERALGLVGAPAGVICLWDEEHQVLIPQAWIGVGDWMGQLRVRPGQGAGGLAALRREGVLQNDYRTSPAAHPVILARGGATAALAEPLLYRERLLGIIVANHTGAEHRFTADDQTILRPFATQAAIAIENARLFREEQKRIEQLDTLRAVTTEVTRELDLSRLLRLITERSIELLGGRSGTVVLWDEDAQVLAPAAWHGHGDWYREVRYRLGEGIVGTVARRRQGIVVNDYRNSPYAHPLFLLRTEITATLAEPLLYRDRLLGVVTVDGYGEGQIFTEHDKQLLSLLASQAAIAIENARLYAATEARSVELSALREIEQAIASHLDLPAVLEAVVAGTMRILDNPFAQIILWDEASHALRFGAARGPEAERVKNQTFELGRGINGVVAQTRKPMILDDYQASPYAVPECSDVVATISAPILFGDRLLGVLHSHTTRAGRRFSPDDLRRLQMLATQAAFAIENARLHEATRKELAERIRAEEDLKQSEGQAKRLAWENAAMAEIGRIIGSTLKIEEVYQSFANEVQKLIAFDRIVISSINVEKNVVRNLYIAGENLSDRNVADLYPLEGSGNAEMVRTKASFLIQSEDFREYQDRFPALASTFRAGFRSILNVPLFARGQIVGGLLLRSRKSNAYTEDDVRLAERIGAQIAGAVANTQLYVENARLYEAAARRNTELEALVHSSKAIGSSLDLDQVLQAIVQQAAAISATPIVRLFLLEEDTQLLRCRVAVGFPPEEARELVMPVGASLSGQVAATGEPLVVPDTRVDHRTHYPAHVAKYGVVSYLGLPVKLQDRLLGVLVFNTPTPRTYSTDEITFLGAFAQQAALAIQNARLYETTLRRGEEREALLRATRSIMAGLDLRTILDQIVAEASHIAAAPHVKVLLVDKAAQVLRVAAAKGTATPVGYEFAMGASLSGRVAQTGEPLFQADSPTDPRNLLAQVDRDLGIVTYLGLPIKRGDEVIGVLTFNTTVPHQYDPEELALLAAFADQAAIAIDNARLFQREQERREQVEAVRSVSEEITRELDPATLFALITKHAAKLLGVGSGTIFLWDAGTETLTPRGIHGHGDWPGDVRLRLGEGVAGTVALRRDGLIVNDYRNSPYTHPEVLERTKITAVLAEPLLYQDRLVGVIAIQDQGTGRRFTTQDLDLLRIFASQAAVAIENARLFRDEHDRRVQFEAVRAVSAEIAQELNLRKVLHLVVQQACALTSATAADIDLWDPDRQLLVPEISYGHTAPRPRTTRRLGEGAMGTVAQARRGMIINDYRSSPVAHPDTLAHTTITASLVEPLLYHDTLLGVIGVDHETPGRTFTTQDRDLLNLFASQVAVAIENARVHEAAVQRAQQLRTLNEVARTLTQTLDPEQAAREIVTAIQILIPEAAGQLWQKVEDPEGFQLVTTVGVQEPGLAFRHRLLPGEGLAGIAAASGEVTISEDVTQDPRFVNRVWAASEGLVSSVALPLVHGEQVFGALIIFTRARHTFDEQEVGLLKSFAAHAAISIDNARLHETVQRHAADLEARVTERTAALEEALRVKAEFLAKMSHELRTPLNFVLGFAELLKQGTGGTLTPKQVNFVDRIVSGGKHLLDLVSDLLDMSLLEAGRKGLQLEAIPLAPLVREVLDLFGIQATQKRLMLRQTVEPGLTVVAERRKLVQILTNLVANAVKFTSESGTIAVTARIAECRVRSADSKIGDARLQSQIEGHASKCFEIAVTDSGIGLAAQDVERIFRGFEQVDGSSTRRHGGAGIGLALVRTLVELHGGQVWAESAGVGHGARFIVQFPHLEAPPPKQILVVEDHIPVLKTLCVFLRDAGFAVEGVATGSEALTAIRDRLPDLVILDIGLPDIDGWEILRRVRADERTHDLRIVVLTGLGESEAEHALTLGANQFLTKPVPPGTLVEVAKELLTGIARRPGSRPPAAGA